SVLFSLGNLQTMASGAKQAENGAAGATQASAPQASAGAASAQPGQGKNDASGLFDIRTLMAQSQGAATAPKGDISGPRTSLPSDLFRMDSAMVIPATLGTPAIPSSMPPEEKKKRWFLFGAGIFGALLFVMLIIFIARALRKPEPVLVNANGTVT